jgi:hypothetical protein
MRTSTKKIAAKPSIRKKLLTTTELARKLKTSLRYMNPFIEYMGIEPAKVVISNKGRSRKALYDLGAFKDYHAAVKLKQSKALFEKAFGILNSVNPSLAASAWKSMTEFIGGQGLPLIGSNDEAAKSLIKELRALAERQEDSLLEMKSRLESANVKIEALQCKIQAVTDQNKWKPWRAFGINDDRLKAMIIEISKKKNMLRTIPSNGCDEAFAYLFHEDIVSYYANKYVSQSRTAFA